MNYVLLAWVFAFSAGTLQAKGLNELTPEVEEEKTELKEVPAATSPDGTAPVAPAATPPEAPAKKEEPKAALTETPPEPSEQSKKLADRLVISTGAAFTQVNGPDGDWGGGGTGDLSATWLLKKDPFPQGRLAKIDLHALARYTPQDVVVRSQGQSYRGIIQTFQGGLLATRPVSETLRIVTHATLGFATTHLKSMDTFTEKASLSSGGLQLGAGGGCDWIFGSKTSAGPRLNLGFGRYQTIGIGGEIGFVF